MRIAVDIRPLLEAQPSGVSGYTHHIVREIIQQGSSDSFVLFYNASSPVPEERLEPFQRFGNVAIRHTRFPNKLFNAALSLFGFPRLNRLIGEVDVFFVPNLSFFSVSRSSRVVLAVHDLSYRYPAFMSVRARVWHNMVRPRRLLKRADSIIAVSPATAQDIKNQYSALSNKIRVIPLGVDKKRFSERSPRNLENVRNKYNLPRSFMLYLGTVEERKNIRGLLEAWMRFKELSQGDTVLVIAGRISDRTLKKEVSSVHWLDYIDEEDKPALLQLAKVFIYPSYFEGFGLPVLEAMQSGTPVVTSQGTSLPFVTQQSALLVDPYNSDDWVHALRALDEKEALRCDLSVAGKKQAAHYSWEKAGRQTLALIHSLKP